MEGILIKEATKELNIEAHVLRYWEEELGLDIRRNSAGHRYYDEKDIRLFREINELREQGVALRDIKVAIDKARSELTDSDDKEQANEEADKTEIVEKLQKKELKLEDKSEQKVVDFKYVQLQNMMNKLIATALQENKKIITTSMKTEIADDVMKQLDVALREKEEREEERFRRLDESIRRIQQAESMIAATKMRKRWWKK